MKSYFLKKTAITLLILLGFHGLKSQTVLLSDKAKVSVITCGTGNESYSLFGHTAIRVKDESQFIDAVYNYGAFDFRTPNFVAKFAKGDLEYFAVVHSFSDFIREYTYEKRAVEEQELKIPLVLKQKLFENLHSSLSSQESHYTYKFIDKNCTSMVVDIINKTLDTTVIVKNSDLKLSFRTILYPYFDNHFYEKLGTSIIFGKKVDALGTKIFLPFELQKSLKTIRYKNHLLAAPNKTILDIHNTPSTSWWNNVYTYLFFLGFILIMNKKGMDLLYFSLMGILGLFFVFMGFYSDHLELQYNYNVLLFNPTLLILTVSGFSKNPKWTRRLAIFNMTSLAFYLLVLFDKSHFYIVLPLIITTAFLLYRLLKKNSSI